MILAEKIRPGAANPGDAHSGAPMLSEGLQRGFEGEDCDSH